MARARHIPQRTCVGCRRKAPKIEMLRIVAAKEGSVAPDPLQVLRGRGAYVCHREDCLRAARKKLAHALRCDPAAVSSAWSAIVAAVESRDK